MGYFSCLSERIETITSALSDAHDALSCLTPASTNVKLPSVSKYGLMHRQNGREKRDGRDAILESTYPSGEEAEIDQNSDDMLSHDVEPHFVNQWERVDWTGPGVSATVKSVEDASGWLAETHSMVGHLGQRVQDVLKELGGSSPVLTDFQQAWFLPEAKTSCLVEDTLRWYDENGDKLKRLKKVDAKTRSDRITSVATEEPHADESGEQTWRGYYERWRSDLPSQAFSSRQNMMSSCAQEVEHSEIDVDSRVLM